MAVKVPTVSEIRAWPVTVDVQTAGRAFGPGRDQAYRLAREGDFPVPVLRLGRYLRISRAAVLRVLDVDLDDDTLAALKQWREVQAEEREKWSSAYQDGGYVFTRQDGVPYTRTTSPRSTSGWPPGPDCGRRSCTACVTFGRQR